MRTLANPPPAIKLAVEAIAVMLGETEISWKALRQMMMRETFISTIVNFDTEMMRCVYVETVWKLSLGCMVSLNSLNSMAKLLVLVFLKNNGIAELVIWQSKRGYRYLSHWSKMLIDCKRVDLKIWFKPRVVYSLRVWIIIFITEVLPIEVDIKV